MSAGEKSIVKHHIVIKYSKRICAFQRYGDCAYSCRVEGYCRDWIAPEDRSDSYVRWCARAERIRGYVLTADTRNYSFEPPINTESIYGEEPPQPIFQFNRKTFGRGTPRRIDEIEIDGKLFYKDEGWDIFDRWEKEQHD